MSRWAPAHEHQVLQGHGVDQGGQEAQPGGVDAQQVGRRQHGKVRGRRQLLAEDEALLRKAAPVDVLQEVAAYGLRQTASHRSGVRVSISRPGRGNSSEQICSLDGQRRFRVISRVQGLDPKPQRLAVGLNGLSCFHLDAHVVGQ